MLLRGSDGVGVMSGFIFFVGIVLLWGAVGVRFGRRKERNSELAELSEQIRVEEFLDENAKELRQARSNKLIEHDSWRKNLKFELGNWVAFVIGGVLLLLSMLLDQNPAHTWDSFWDRVKQDWSYVVGFGFAFYFLYLLEKRLQNIEREMKWLRGMLEKVYWKTRRDRSELEYQINTLKRS
jgi:hypothetical protein